MSRKEPNPPPPPIKYRPKPPPGPPPTIGFKAMKKNTCFIAIFIILIVQCVGCANMAKNRAEYQANKAAFAANQITPDVLRGLSMGRMLSQSTQKIGNEQQEIITWVIRDYPSPNNTTYFTFINGELKNRTISPYRRR